MWSACETARILDNTRREQTKGATFPSGIQEQRIHSRISPPHHHHHGHHILLLCASSSHTGVSSRSGERRLLNHDWSGNPLHKIGGIKQNKQNKKWNTKKRSFNFGLCAANPLPREAWCCVSRLHSKKRKRKKEEKTRTPSPRAVMREARGGMCSSE